MGELQWAGSGGDGGVPCAGAGGVYAAPVVHVAGVSRGAWECPWGVPWGSAGGPLRVPM